MGLQVGDELLYESIGLNLSNEFVNLEGLLVSLHDLEHEVQATVLVRRKVAPACTNGRLLQLWTIMQYLQRFVINL